MRQMEIYIIDVHHVLWGEYPIRQTEFVAESLEVVRQALQSDRFREMEDRLKQFTENYSRKIIPYREGFQL